MATTNIICLRLFTIRKYDQLENAPQNNGPILTWAGGDIHQLHLHVAIRTFFLYHRLDLPFALRELLKVGPVEEIKPLVDLDGGIFQLLVGGVARLKGHFLKNTHNETFLSHIMPAPSRQESDTDQLETVSLPTNNGCIAGSTIMCTFLFYTIHHANATS